MDWDGVPVAVGSVVAGVAPVLPGPTKDEWTGALVAVLALVARELVAWLRRRRT